MGKWWSSLFGVVLLACFLLFIVSPLIGWWMPEGVSTHAGSVDWLFYLILYITGFFFVLTEAILVYFMFKFGSGQKPVEGAGPPEFLKKIIPDQHRLEIAWSIVPAAILLIIAFTQVNTWAQVKYRSRMPTVEARDSSAGKTNTADNPIQLEVSARQFEWRIRYPSPKRMETWLTKKDKDTAKDFKSFTRTRQYDDIHLVNEIHAVVNRPVVVQLKTLDVIHSFNLPHLRVKQDALPGQTIPVWFTPTKVNTRSFKLPAPPKNVKRIDADNMTLTFLPAEKDGKDETYLVTAKTKFRNAYGEDLGTGIKADEIKEAEFLHYKFDKDTKALEVVQLPDLTRWEDQYNSDTKKPNDPKFKWELACAELCGWGHYRMIGRLFVHESQADFMNWFKHRAQLCKPWPPPLVP